MPSFSVAMVVSLLSKSAYEALCVIRSNPLTERNPPQGVALAPEKISGKGEALPTNVSKSQERRVNASVRMWGHSDAFTTIRGRYSSRNP
jgi:hypothetical protein